MLKFSYINSRVGSCLAETSLQVLLTLFLTLTRVSAKHNKFSINSRVFTPSLFNIREGKPSEAPCGGGDAEQNEKENLSRFSPFGVQFYQEST